MNKKSRYRTGEHKGKIKKLLADDAVAVRVYLLAWTIFLFGETLSTTMFEVPGKFFLLCKALPLLMVFIKIILFDRFSPRTFWLAVFAAALGVGIVASSGYTEPVLWLVMLIGAKDVPWRKILQVYVLVVVSVVFLAFCASLLDVIENLQYEREGDASTYRVRNSFGTVYTTDFASHVFSCCLGIFYLLRERLKVWHYLVVAVIAGLVFLFCNTRLDVACIYMLLVVFAVLQIRERKRSLRRKYDAGRRLRGKLCWFMPFAALVMFLLTLAYRESSSIMVMANELTSHRLELGLRGLRQYGMTLLGQYVEMVGYGGTIYQTKDYFFMDCSYLYVFLRYGVIFLLVVLGVYVLCSGKFRDDPYFLAVIVLVSINCMIAHHLVELTYNPFALALFAAAPGTAGVWKTRECGGELSTFRRLWFGEF